MKDKVIIYASVHHQNTELVVDYLSGEIDADLIDITKTEHIDTSAYDTIIFASGIYFKTMHQSLLKVMTKNIVANKKVIIIYTCGIRYKDYAAPIKDILVNNGAHYLGAACCRGYDTFGLLEKIGGIAKGHPTKADIQAVSNRVSRLLERNNL